MIYLCTQADQAPPDLLAQAMQRMPAGRRAQISRYRDEEPRRNGTIAWLLLEYALRREYDCRLREDFVLLPGGKPGLSQYPQLHFNLSHSAAAVACALSANPVGIDVEQCRPISDKLCRFVLSEHEYEQLQSADDRQLYFFRCWTRKESLLKLTGSGLRRELKSVLEHSPAAVDFLTSEYDASIVLSVCAYRGQLPALTGSEIQLCNSWDLF